MPTAKRRALRAFKYVLDRLSEASTIRAIIVLLAAGIGHSITPEHLEHAILIGVLIAQTVAMLIPDKIERKKKNGVLKSSEDSEEKI